MEIFLVESRQFYICEDTDGIGKTPDLLAALAWSNLFAWVRQNVEVELETIFHKAPVRLDEFM